MIGNPPPYYVFLADAGTIADPELSILVVDTSEPSSAFPTFRVHPSQMAAVENNLALANMDFGDISSAVGADGVFRGFTPPTTTKNLPKAALLEAIDRSTLSKEAITEYRATLEALRRDDVYPTFVSDVRRKHMDLRDRRHEYESCSWLVGLDETIDVLSNGGAAIRFSLPASPQPGRLSGYCSVWVDAISLVPIAVLANGVPAHSTAR